MTKHDVKMLKEALVPKDEDYEKPCISPHNLEIVLDQLLLDQAKRTEDRTMMISTIIGMIIGSTIGSIIGTLLSHMF